MSNYPILFLNVMGSLQTEIARKAFLWACDAVDDTRAKYPAEEYAREVDRLVLFLKPLIRFSGNLQKPDFSDEMVDDLMEFILRRHLILTFPKARRYWV